nr:SAV_2336 N-terminal domain-related protein [Streptomyces mexicanus]
MRASPGPPPAPPAATPAAPSGTSPKEPGAARVPLRLPGPRSGGDGAYRALLAPAPPMLSHPLALQRALRPLKRRVPAPVGHELDEEATAHRIARFGADPRWWLPVLRPAAERWLALHLVHDAGPTMPVWRPLIRELRTALAQSGVFRTVEVHRLAADGTTGPGGPAAPHGDGRSVTLLISDCMGPQWRAGPAGTRWYRTLRRWARTMPVAVIQPLPERLWRTTALPAATARLSAPGRAAPNAAYTVEFSTADPAHEPASGTLPLPVLEATSPWLATWARLVASPARMGLTGSVGLLAPEPPHAALDAEGRGDVDRLDAEELVLRFRSIASPEAFRLAGHLAVGQPQLPVMRLVQAAVEPDPRPQHLAEVILSGVLTTTAGPPGSYAFRPGVREVLLRTLPHTARSRTAGLLARAGQVIDARAGVTAGDFRVVAPDEAGDTHAAGEPIAEVGRDSVRRLGGRAPRELIGGRYRLVRQRGLGRRVWEAVDEQEAGRRVVVHLYPPQEGSPARFLREAEVLAGVRSPQVASVLDFGTDAQTPYLVVEFTDGVTLTELLATSGAGVSCAVFARVVSDGEAGLRALHAQGLVRGQRGPEGLLLRPDGTVVLSRFALGEESLDKDAAWDLFHFGQEMRRLASEVDVPPEHRRLLDLIDAGDLAEAAGYARSPELRERTRWGFALLGPLRVTLGGREVPGRLSPEAKALLCLLLHRAGRRVTHRELAEGLWEQPPPEDAAAGHLLRLSREVRRLLGPGTVAALSDGYALHVPGADIDTEGCEVLSARTPNQDPEARRLMLREALDLFRGDPLEEIPGPFAARERARLRALRTRIAGALAELGAPGAAVDGPRPARPVVVFEADGLGDRHDDLTHVVTRLMSRGNLAPEAYEVLPRADGCVVLTEPGAYVLPVLVAVVRGLPEAVADLAEVSRLRVTFWHEPRSAQEAGADVPERVRHVLDRAAADLVVVVSPTLYEQYTRSSAALGPERFQPLRTAPGTDPLAWYCRLPRTADATERDLVRGPFTTADLTALGPGEPGRTAIVHTLPDGSAAVLDPAAVRGARHGRPATYYEVDLTVHRAGDLLTLPASGGNRFTATVELSWHVEDPVAFVRGRISDVAGVLFDHFAKEAAAVTRRHLPYRARAAAQAVDAALREWPVPGLAVTHSVQLAPARPSGRTGRRAGRGEPSLPALLDNARTVLIGFDGPVTTLFSAPAARQAALELLRLVAEHRDPQQALSGRPLLRDKGRSSVAPGSFVHPLQVLRAFADQGVAPALRERLDRIELDAAANSPLSAQALSLVRALDAAGRRVSVVTDVSERAVHRVLDRHGLPLAGVHGRGPDLTRLMPEPDRLRHALDAAVPPAPPDAALLVSSSPAELTAARRLGLPCVGYVSRHAAEEQLLAAGCDATVFFYEPLLHAARSL